MKTQRIGVFIDGNYLNHASNYYNYTHPKHRRLHLGGLHDFVRNWIAQSFDTDRRLVKIVESHYFRIRINAFEASNRGNQLFYDRQLDDILSYENIRPHYIVYRQNGSARKETPSMEAKLSIEVLDACFSNKLDAVALFVNDGAYADVAIKVASLGIPVYLFHWEFEYQNDEGNEVVVRTSYNLLEACSYSVNLSDLIDKQRSPDYWLDKIFVSERESSASQQTPEDDYLNDDQESDFQYPDSLDKSDSLENLIFEKKRFNISTDNSSNVYEGEILTLKNGYGFIKYPNNNLFFHHSDVLNADFQELQPGEKVMFSVAKNDQGQDVAKEVRKLTY
ncbi:MAG: cold shock domain-containing protein [Thermaurantimonas sp.]|uniref:cold shock domain-containing protein n=1 Tax=Thermaurantimonas sp. TaxID=2681568 RepID=UPI00391CF39C